MSKHTPGPWGLRKSETGTWAVFNADGIWIATTLLKAWKAEDEANARLIAAAPELLDALIAITSPIASLVAGEEVLQNALAAIAKARGAA